MSAARDGGAAEPVPRVLIVDDHRPNLIALAAILDPLDIEVISAISGEDALMEVLKYDFALILMDVQMPGLDGFQTTSLIKNRPRSRHVPVIFLTAISRDEANAFKGYANGGVDYVLKPFDPAVLRSKVGVFVDLWKQRQVIQRQERELASRGREALTLRNEARWREITDALPAIVWGVDAKGGIHFANSASKAFFGKRGPTSVLDLSVLHPDDAPRVQDQWRKAMASGERFEWQARILRPAAEPDGAVYRWHAGVGAPEHDENGALGGWVSTAIDIDEKQRTEAVRACAALATLRLAAAPTMQEKAEAVTNLLVPGLAAAASVQLLDEAGQELPAIRKGAPEEVFACVTVPLLGRDRALGSLWVARTRGEPPFAAEEVLMIEELARRASLAIDEASAARAVRSPAYPH